MSDRNWRQDGGPDDLQVRHLGLRLIIVYEDAYGDVTEREITLLRIAMDREVDGSLHATHILAFCHLRRDERLFRMDRLREVVDAATGEVLSDIGPWLLERLTRPAAPPSAPKAPRLIDLIGPSLHDEPASVQTPKKLRLSWGLCVVAAIVAAALFVASRVERPMAGGPHAPVAPPLTGPADETWPQAPAEPARPQCAPDINRPPICGPGRVERGSF